MSHSQSQCTCIVRWTTRRILTLTVSAFVVWCEDANNGQY